MNPIVAIRREAGRALSMTFGVALAVLLVGVPTALLSDGPAWELIKALAGIATTVVAARMWIAVERIRKLTDPPREEQS